MAQLIRQPRIPYNKLDNLPLTTNFITWANNMRRGMIAAKSTRRIIQAAQANDTKALKELQALRQQLADKRETVVYENDPIGPYDNNREFNVHNRVSIIDLDDGGYDKSYRIIELPSIPIELNYGAESTFAAIKGIGRNTFKYHFTGSEDILEFDIDWYSSNHNRREVIQKCRDIESLSKSDGYEGDPHRVMLQWGEDNTLFEKHVFIIISAKYRLTQFSNAHKQGKNIIDDKLLPVQAYQTVRLARISSYNLTTNDIKYVAAIESSSNSTLLRSELSKGI